MPKPGYPSKVEPTIVDRILEVRRDRLDDGLPADVLVLGARQWEEVRAHFGLPSLLGPLDGRLFGMVICGDEREDALESRALDGAEEDAGA